ncbi:MAG: PorT family protein [Candidatus Symbiothrix sp.]|jgi:hypothetical protein|nr:PorT family protein [Candidatus Symbiothrix sp.]
MVTKSHLIFTGLVSVGLLFSGVGKAQMRFGMKGGYHVADVRDLGHIFSRNDTQLEFSISYATGYSAGLLAQCDLPLGFFLQSELLFSAQTEIKDYNDEQYSEQVKFLKIPLYLGYKLPLGLGISAVAGVGPYFAYGVNGSSSFKEKNLFYRREHGAMSVMAGIQTANFQLVIVSDRNLIDHFFKKDKDLYSAKNLHISLNLACFF